MTTGGDGCACSGRLPGCGRPGQLSPKTIAGNGLTFTKARAADNAGTTPKPFTCAGGLACTSPLAADWTGAPSKSSSGGLACELVAGVADPTERAFLPHVPQKRALGNKEVPQVHTAAWSPTCLSSGLPGARSPTLSRAEGSACNAPELFASNMPNIISNALEFFLRHLSTLSELPSRVCGALSPTLLLGREFSWTSLRRLSTLSEYACCLCGALSTTLLLGRESSWSSLRRRSTLSEFSSCLCGALSPTLLLGRESSCSSLRRLSTLSESSSCLCGAFSTPPLLGRESSWSSCLELSLRGGNFAERVHASSRMPSASSPELLIRDDSSFRLPLSLCRRIVTATPLPESLVPGASSAALMEGDKSSSSLTEPPPSHLLGDRDASSLCLDLSSRWWPLTAPPLPTCRLHGAFSPALLDSDTSSSRLEIPLRASNLTMPTLSARRLGRDASS
mmetsp:Transcript_141459/g.452168  ORF Transcript_141459/g.452168 Transcript_141459/m.452168 type:complete len:450 (-) Transcript_141459:354-1703(-)